MKMEIKKGDGKLQFICFTSKNGARFFEVHIDGSKCLSYLSMYSKSRPIFRSSDYGCCLRLLQSLCTRKYETLQIDSMLIDNFFSKPDSLHPSLHKLKFNIKRSSIKGITGKLIAKLVELPASELYDLTTFEPYLIENDTSRMYIEKGSYGVAILALLLCSILGSSTELELLQSLWDVNDFDPFFNEYGINVSKKELKWTILYNTNIEKAVLDLLLPCS